LNPELAGALLSGTGLLASVIGFGATLYQISKTRSAAEAAQSAVTRTEQQLAVNHMMLLIPQLAVIETEIEASASSKSREGTLKQITR